MVKSLVAGGVAGTISKLLVYPLDTCKKRLQATSFSSPSNEVLSAKIVGTIRLVIQKEGMRGLYRGVGPTIMKSCVGTGVTFAVFRGVERVLKEHHDRRTMRE